jgi:GNAT superfamily N-acetyltransferase
VEEAELGLLRELRLRALSDDPSAFGRTYGEEFPRAPETYAPWVTEGVTVVAESDDGWHGLGAASVDKDDFFVAHVYSMWVEPELRGTGIGRDLLQTLLGWAWEAGATRVRVGVVEGNDRAQALYRRGGFRLTGDREPLVSDPSRDCVFLELSQRQIPPD